jgi:hypothetical protein
VPNFQAILEKIMSAIGVWKPLEDVEQKHDSSGDHPEVESDT